MAKRMISDLKEGDEIRSYFIVREKTKSLIQRGKRKGEPFLSVDLMDASGSISGKIWDDAERFSECFKKGDVVAVRAMVESFQEKPQLNIKDVRCVDERDKEHLDRSDLLPRTKRDAGEMRSELNSVIASIGDEDFRGLVSAIFADERIGKAFESAVAARDRHHNYIGGLMEHTLSVTAVADLFCRHYGSEINRDLVIAGALLHDLGKIREIDFSRDFNYTIEGSLIGHISIGVEIVRKFADRSEGFPREKLILLEHLIISHHGLKEWASPIEPKTPEALVLHLTDLVDARMFQMLRAVKSDANVDDPFTPMDPGLRVNILKVHDPEKLKGFLDPAL